MQMKNNKFRHRIYTITGLGLGLGCSVSVVVRALDL